MPPGKIKESRLERMGIVELTTALAERGLPLGGNKIIMRTRLWVAQEAVSLFLLKNKNKKTVSFCICYFFPHEEGEGGAVAEQPHPAEQENNCSFFPFLASLPNHMFQDGMAAVEAKAVLKVFGSSSAS